MSCCHCSDWRCGSFEFGLMTLSRNALSVAPVQNLFQTSRKECDENLETGGQIQVCNLAT